MSRLALFLLGSPRFERDGEPVQVDRRKAVALLAYLAVTGRSHSRDALATLFWPEGDQSQARAGLRRALAALKKALQQVHPEQSRGAQDAALGKGWLDVDRETVGLNPDAEVWLDVGEFQERLAACRSHGHPPDQVCLACLSALAEAAALYRDDFLAGFTLRDSPAFDEWQFFQTQGLRDDLAGALERLAHGHSAQGEFEPAVAYARRWLALDPLHEPAHRCLMQLYAQSGQRAAALRQYAECERILQEELGVPPQEETTQLFQAVKGGRETAAEDSQPERYRFERKLSSKGSFGTLWLATDTRLDRLVAVKCPKVAHDPVQRERFVTEARMLARLNHPNIRQIYDALFDEAEDRFFLVMEYVDGKDLAAIIGAGTPLPLDWVLDVAMGILQALSYAHGQGLVHRDVKPANVMIADDVKLIDFGLADLKSILQRGTRFLAGTVAYMAPEQVEGRPTDGRADLYALGVILFEMLSGGRLPFDCTDEVEMLAAHLHTPPPPVSQFAPTVPPALEQVIIRLLAKDPEDRYPSAEAVIEVLSAVPVGPRLHNLPVELTAFVGRERMLSQIAERLDDPDCRLLTLVGPGGSGKTRLAVKAAEAQLDHYPHGVFLVLLAPLESVDAIVPTVAEAFGFTFYEGVEPRKQLLDYLRQKAMLIIMDNFEHLLESTGLVTEILKTAPDVKILATSRVRLNVGGEHRFQVSGMDYPKSMPKASVDAVRYSAVKLFLQGARRAQPGFELTEENLSGVVDVCRLVEGMPLGVRLAAAWVTMISPQEIATEIGQSLDVLATQLRDVPQRQRSMRAVFDHSWHLLTKREQEVFQGLSVFHGGFTREAAQQVTGASLRDLMSLVNKSLLDRTSAPSTEYIPSRAWPEHGRRVEGLRTGGRYGVHELLRWYAAEKLETSGEADAARNAHSTYYAEFLHQREEDLKGRRQLGALNEIEVEFENVRAAWNWALKQKDYTAIGQLLRSLGWFCTFRSRSLEHAELFQQAREQLAPGPDDKPHPVWGRILVAEFYARPHAVDRAQIERGLAIVQQLGDQELIAVCLRTLGEVAFYADDYAEALSFFETSLAHYRALDDGFNIAATLSRLAETHRFLGEPEEAIKFARQSLDLSREIGDRFWAARSLANTGVIAFFSGSYSEAEAYLGEANAVHRQMGYRPGIAEACVQLSRLATLRGDFHRARALAEEALEIAADIGRQDAAQLAHWVDSLAARATGEETEDRPEKQESVPIVDIPTRIDKYEVKRLLGVGGAAALYLAHDPDSSRDVVVKVANPEFLNKFDWALKLFELEDEVLAKLAQHAAFPEYYGYGETADSVYIVMEFIKGKDLEVILEEQEGFLPQKDVIEWVIQVCDALTHMHSQRPLPLIFRDVQPANVMIDQYGRVRLIDLGIVEVYRPGREQRMIGTEGYAAPEQYFGYSDARSDIFALGATLHHVLTRRDPRKEAPFSFHDAPPRSLNPAISEELEAVILKAVEHHPEDRYQSVDEMKNALLACL